jgi:hypothetical protein
MKIKLAPSGGAFWALMHPAGTFYVGGETNEGSYSKANTQEIQVILTSEEPGPIEVDYAGLPGWAKNQILSSSRAGYILTDSSVEEVVKRTVTPQEPALVPKMNLTTGALSPISEINFGVLELPISEIRTKALTMSASELSDLLSRELQGSNPSGKSRATLVAYLKGKIESLKE